MSVTSSTHNPFNLEQEISDALTSSKTPLALETLAAAGVPLKKINQIGRAAIATSKSDGAINAKLQELNEWAKAHSKSKSKVNDILVRIFALDDPDEAKHEIDLFIKAGGKTKDVYRFVERIAKDQIPENPDDRIKLLENISAVSELDVARETSSSPKRGFLSIKTPSKDYKIEDACKQVVHQLSGNTDLIIQAAKTGHKEIARTLADETLEGVDQCKAITEVIKKNNLEKLEVLLALGYDANAIDENGSSVLISALKNGCSKKVVSLLLRYGGNVELADPTGATPIHYAVHFGNWPAADVLIKNGANVNHQDQDGTTPLHRAKKSDPDPAKQLDMWRKLVKAGADPTIRDIFKGAPCNTPLTQIIYYGNPGLIVRMFRGYPKLIDIATNTPIKERLGKMRASAFELSQQTDQDVEFTPLEIALFIQDPALTNNIMAMLPPENIQSQIDRLREHYPQCHFLRTLSEATVAPTKQHVLQFGDIASTTVPDQTEYDGSNKEKVKRLMEMLDKVLLKEGHPEGLKFEGDPGYRRGPKYKDHLKQPGDPGYRDLKNFRDVHGHSFTALELREKMQCLLNDIENRQAKPGTPPGGEVEKLEHWYRYLESTLCEIIDVVDFEDEYEATADDPTPNAATVIEIALTGGHCGGWYMGESQKIKQQKKGTITGLQDQIMNVLSVLHQGICEGLVPIDYEQNTHMMNNILQVIDESAGIKEDQKRSRFYFLDQITPLERHTEEITRRFWQNYSPTLMLDHLDHAIHQSHSINKELVIDWLKENIPEEFEKETLEAIQQDLHKISSLEKQIQYLADKHQLTIQLPAPIEDQLVQHYIEQSDAGDQYKAAMTIIYSMSRMKDHTMMINLIRKRFGLTLDPNKSFEKQVQDHFFSQLPTTSQTELQKVMSAIEGTSYEKAAKVVNEMIGFKVKPLPDIQNAIHKWRASRFLASQISSDGHIAREALVYMLGKLGILEARTDMVHPKSAHMRFLRNTI